MSEIPLKQILAMRACPRAWAAKNLLRLPDPKNQYAQEGIDFHAACEAYLRTGSFDFDQRTRSPEGEWSSRRIAVGPESHLGKLAKAAVAFAPVGALAEMNQAFDLFGRSTTCHIDVLWPDWSEFGDWKSSSGYRELSKNTLPNDMQANFQAFGMMQGSGQRSMKGAWVYANKKTYRARAVLGEFSRADCEDFLRREALPAIQLIELFRELHDQGKLTELKQVPHDLTACEGTGKFCNYLGHCRFQPSTGATLLQLRSHK
jgi:hypothetical protein